MSFIWPLMLLGLISVPLLGLLYRRQLRQRHRATQALGPMGILQNQSGNDLGRRRHLPFVFYLLGLALLLFALARPEMPLSLPRVEGTVILAFDISHSMAADDLVPSRIAAAKTAARTFVESQPSTVKIGVVAFSNGGIIVQPPTDLQVDVLATIDRLSAEGGTSLGQGIFTALDAIAKEPIVIDEAAAEQGIQAVEIENLGSAVIVLLSDGENTDPPNPLVIADLASRAGVRIYTIGVGSAEGTVIEVEGFSIVTQLNEETLQQIASLTNGRYFHAEDEEQLQEIYDNIDLQLTIAGETMEITAIVAGIGLLFLLLGSALSMILLGRVP